MNPKHREFFKELFNLVAKYRTNITANGHCIECSFDRFNEGETSYNLGNLICSKRYFTATQLVKHEIFDEEPQP